MGSGCNGVAVGFIGAIVLLCVFSFLDKAEEKGAKSFEQLEQIVQRVEVQAQERIARINERYERERLLREQRFATKAQGILARMAQTHQQALQSQTLQRKQDEIRRFSLKEAPDAWMALSRLKAEQVSLEKQISELESALSSFGETLSMDPELAQLRKSKKDVEGQIDAILAKLEKAYLLSRKHEAMPNAKAFEEAVQAQANDGLFSAEMLEQHYSH